MSASPTRLTADDRRALLEAGGRAPSAGNLQAWLIEFVDGGLDVRVNPSRGGGSLDPAWTFSLLGLGLFAENVRVVAASRGLEMSSDVTTGHAPLDAVLCLRFSARLNGPEEDPLHRAVFERHVNRHWSDGTSLAADTVNALLAGIRAAGLRAVSLGSGGEKRALARLVGTADELRFRSEQQFREMVHEIAWTDDEAAARREGIPLRALELPGAAAELLATLRDRRELRALLPSVVYRDFFRPWLIESSHVVVVAVERAPGPREAIEAGMLIERLWLEATQRGIALHPWPALVALILRVELVGGDGLTPAQIATVRELATELRALLQLPADAAPIFLFRLSRPRRSATVRAPRRGAGDAPR